MTAALEGSEWSAARPGRTLPPGKTRYPLYRRLGGPQGRSGRAENLVPTGIRSRTVQPVVSRYTDWATRPTTTTQRGTNEWHQLYFVHPHTPHYHHIPLRQMEKRLKTDKTAACSSDVSTNVTRTYTTHRHTSSDSNLRFTCSGIKY